MGWVVLHDVLSMVLEGSVRGVARVEGVGEHVEARVRHLQTLHLVVEGRVSDLVRDRVFLAT